MQSFGRGEIRMSEEVHTAMRELRSFMFRSVYTNPTAKGEEKKAEAMIPLRSQSSNTSAWTD